MTEHTPEPSRSYLMTAPDVEEAFAQLNAVVVPGSGGVDTAQLLKTSLSLIPSAEHAGITLVRGTRPPRGVAATSDVPRQSDAIQNQVLEGPCLEAATEHTVVLAKNLAAETRWPKFSARCVSTTGMHSILCLRLVLSEGDSGALNLYASDVDAFSETDITVASILATFAALALARELHRDDVEGLHVALDSNRQIATAVGILMSRHQLTREAAFGQLRQASNVLNRKLADLAVTVEYTGDLPSASRRPSPPAPGSP